MRRALPRFIFALAAFGVALQACDKVEVVTPDPPTVSIAPSTITIDVGERTRLTASVVGGSGTGTSVSWSSSDPVVVSVDASGEIVGLAVGSATVTARSAGGVGTASVTVRPPTSAQLDRPSVSFTAAPGGVAAPETVRITAPGPDGMTGLVATPRYTPGQPQGWLRTALSSTSTPASLLVSADARSLPVGTYAATVEITADGGSAVSVSVTLQVVGAPPTIALNADSVGFAANEAGTDPQPQQIAITNSGTGSLGQLSVSAITYASGQPGGWLSASLSTTAAPSTLVLDAAVTSLVQGVYTATLEVISPDAANSPRPVRVTFNVTAPLPIIALNPTTLAFAAVQGGSSPMDQTVSVTNGGIGTLSGLSAAAVYPSSPIGWIVTSLSSGTAPATVTVSIDPSGLPPGDHAGFLRVESLSAANSPVLVPVDLTVTAAPVIALSQATVTFTATAGQADPPTESVVVTNLGGSVLDGLAVDSIVYAVGQRAGWLSSSLSFPLAPSTLALDATLNPPGGPLAPGTYDATVYVGASADGVTNSPQALPVAFFVVNTDPVATITAPPTGQTYTAGTSVTFSGSGFDAEDGTLTGPALVWTSDLDGPLGIGISFTSSTLSLGTHTVTLTVTDGQGATGTASVTVVIDSAPTAAITAPADSSVFNQGATITFTGTGTDPEDGALSGSSLVWASSQNGAMGTGASLPYSTLAVGFHTISLIAVDAQGAADTASIVVRINGLPLADAGADLSVADGDGSGDEDVALDGSASVDAEGALVSYDWSEGGNHLAVGATPTVTLAVGSHPITLTVTDSDGAQDVDTVVVTVGANGAPVASIASPLDGAVIDEGTAISFDGSASDPEDGSLSGGSLTWSSSLDGFLSSGNTFSSAGLSPGPHVITLTALDSGGAGGVATVSIRLNTLPTADAGLDQTSIADADNSGDETVGLDGSASFDVEGPLAAYEWSEGGAVLSSVVAPSLTLAVGQHTLTLTVTDSDGAQDTDDVVVSIGANSGPAATIAAPVDGSVFAQGATIAFVGSGTDPEDGALTGGALAWSSDVSGTFGTGSTVSTAALPAGTHSITLTATDSGGFTGSDAITIRVNAPPTANAGPDQILSDADNSGSEVVTLDGSASSDPEGPVANFAWSTPSATIASVVSPTVTLPVGVHTVTLTVTDQDGSQASDDVVVTVGANSAPVAAISSPPSGAVFPLGAAVPLSGSGSDAEDGALSGGSLVWSSTLSGPIGSGSPIAPTSLIAGTHTVVLTATDAGGLTGTAAISIRVNAPPTANAGVSQTVVDADNSGGEVVTLDGSASSDPEGALASYVWTEGATPVATGVNPAVTLGVGTHTITLTVTDTDGSTAADDVVVTVTANTAPVATIQAPGNGSVFSLGSPVTLSGSGSDPEDGVLGGGSLSWTSSLAGPLGTGASITTSALAAGTHIITLVATDAGGLTGSDAITVRVNTPPTANAGPDQSLTDADGSGSESVALDGSSSTDAEGALASYVWTEGATTVGIGVSPTVSLAVGVHNITLTVTDSDGAQSTDALTVTVAGNSPPTSSISAPATGSIFTRGASITFDGTGSDPEDGVLTGASLVWTSSLNGLLGTGATLSTSALTAGTHTISLTASDSGGLSGTDAITIRVNAPPTPNAGPDQTVTDADNNGTESVALDGSASTDAEGALVGYQWTEGATPVGTGVSPVVAFSVGVHTITLTVTDSDGATATDDVTVTVGANTAPTASISAPADGAVFAPGVVVDFTGAGSDVEDGTLGAGSLTWTSSVDGALGTGGAVSTGTLSAGTHTITLTATDSGGLTGTDAITVRINAPPVADAGPDQNVTDADQSGAELVTLDGSGSSDAEGPLAGYVWAEGGSQIASGVNPSVLLTVGIHVITLTVTDSDGSMAVDDVVVTVGANTAPTAAVASPADGSVFDFGTSVVFTGSGNDAEDGVLTAGSLVWTSSLNGPLGTGASVTASGLTAGAHTITLTATDAGGLTGMDVITVRVNAPPVADAGPDQTVPDSDNSGDESVTLDGSGSSDAEGALVSYVWTEGGSQIATGVSPSVTLGVAVHLLTLTVTDSDGTTATDDVTVTVVANGRPTASITSPPDGSTFLRGATVTFVGSGDDPEDGPLPGSALTWTSDLDGPFGSGVSISTSGLSLGVHVITLIATDSGGLTGTTSITVTINQPPVADAGPDQNLTDTDLSGDESVTLDGSLSTDSDGTVVSWDWTTPAATIPSGVSPSVTLPLGVHTITLTVTDDGGATATDDVVVTIAVGNQAPTADAGPDQPSVTDGDNSGDASVTLDGSLSTDSDGTVVSWDWTTAAATIPSGVSPSVTLPVGVHTITLTATDDDGATDTDDVVVTVLANQAPTADAGPDQNATDTDLSGDESVTLDGSLSTDVDGTVVSWDWTTAAATIPSGVSPSVTLPLGVHTITLTVTDDGGATATDDVVVTINAGNQPPTANAGPDQNLTDTDLSGDESVTLDGSLSTDSDGTVVSWDWTTPAATIPSGVSPSVTLPLGVHTITLTVTDDGGATATDDVVVTIAVGNQAPTADAGPDQPSVTDGDNSGDASVTLDGSLSTDSDGTVVSWDWTTPAATIPSGVSPSVTLPVGVHTITLTATDDDGATDTDDVVVTVLANQAPTADAGPDQNATDTDLSGDESVTLDGSLSTDVDGTVVSWDWTTAAATIPSGVSPSVTLPLGVHTITLTVTDNAGATATDDVVVTINAGNQPPTADAGPDQNLTDTDLSGDESVTLDGSLSTDSDGTVVSWDWTTPAATIPSGVSPSVTLPLGVHTITLTVTDDGGATATDDVVVTIAVGNQAPTADAGPDQPSVTDGDNSGDASVTLDGSLSTDSDGTVVSWDWTTPAATIPSGVSPSVTLPVGVHTITLTATDDDGATDTDDVVVTVLANQAPTADAGPDQNATDTDLSGDESVTLDGSLSTDVDGTVVSWDWTTAAATIPSGVNPSVTLPLGVHTITLTVTDDGGATATDDVVVTINAGNQPPTANAGPDQNLTDTDLSGDESVTLDGSLSTDSDGTVVSWDWTTPAATIPSGVSPSVTLPLGVHTITLTVTDDGGATATDDVVVTIAVGNQAPTADAGPDQPSVTDGDNSGDASVTLDGSLSTDSDGTVVSWDWTTPAATIPSGVSPSVTLPVGVHTITLTATDDDGATDTDDVVVTVLANQAPTADAGSDQNLTDTDLSGDESVTLDGSLSTDVDGTVVSWDWTTAAATIPSGVSPSVTLPLGVHTITLTATDDGGATATDDVVVTINPGNQPPTATISGPPDGSIVQPSASVTFTGSGSDAEDGTLPDAALAWSSSLDGALGTGTSLSTSALSVGTHTITLTATDTGLLTDTDVITIRVNAPPTADAGPDQSPTDTDASGDEQVTLDGSGSSDQDGTIASWDWSGAVTTSGVNPTVTLAVGVHNITLTVTDNDGATAVDDIVVTVGANQAPTADAGPDQPSVSDPDGSGDQAVSLDGSLSTDDGSIVTYDWTAPGVTIPSGVNPTAIFPVGTHTVTLTVTDDGLATDTDDVIITVNANVAPVAAITAPGTGLSVPQGTQITFAGSGTDPEQGSLTGTSLVWTSDLDGQIGTDVTFANASLTVGTHTITLTVTDAGGLTGTAVITVTIT